MSKVRVYRLFICPQTHIRTTDSERWMFSEGITDEYLLEFGKKKYDERVLKGSKNPGTPNNYYNRKKLVQKYWDYKRDVKRLAMLQLMVLPTNNIWVKFYLPMPESWSQKKKKKMCFELHESRPDADNLFKALTDGLMGEDKTIADFRASKFWYDGEGHIEISVNELSPPVGYTKIIREDKIK